ncbi:type II CRISPR RNA-guided endonuclease Cas9 [Reichenbachiella agarivorans]|uniref:CRISPR-associated endonuclease Cas9 n=1 Tax=Reichenbachiella agarivorans TaxID=2979464 RepID=A0ABY6CTD2_9BACT|nr:type II CRISPR RNA-guided endonuclease Cas9 [Reichenbachiella agarivorans]UXP31500.1 type II CRISPR RNA-guided endonuclease Cas9 [Reichenbachiella agarivorans]
MKRILGLDIGVSSVGLAIINKNDTKTSIEHLSVRIVPEDPDFHGKFYSGNTASKNLARTEKRGVRRNNQRFKQRRDKLYRILKEHDMFPSKELFLLNSRELYSLRAKAVTEQISIEELGRVLIHLNQRRGFLSNRKSLSDEENSTEYKERIAELEKRRGESTIGQSLYQELIAKQHPHEVLLRERTYLRSSYTEEFDRIWTMQKQYYSQLTGGVNETTNKNTLYDLIRNRILFYQRPLKSQKGLISNCSFEKGHKAIAKSSPYFELYRIWQRINDLSWKDTEGITHFPSLEQKNILFKALWEGADLNAKYKLTASKIKVLLGFSSRERIYLNFTELDGNRTYSALKKALELGQVANPEQYLHFNYKTNDEKGGLFELWHLTYSLPDTTQVAQSLAKRFRFTESQSEIIAKSVGYSSEYGKLSTRAIRKLLPHLESGLGYSIACDKVGYDHSGYKTKIEIQEKLKPIKQNSLRNPVVEQILNQVVNMVNQAIDTYGTFDEVRIELARELRNSAATRKNISKSNASNKRRNDWIRNELKINYGFRLVNGRDVKRYRLWEETDKVCLYCNKTITGTDLLHRNADIEHILPKSRSFNNAMSNYILAHQKCNNDKGQRTAFDFMSNKDGDALDQYISNVNTLYKDGAGSISRQKFNNLMTQGADIPSDFVERMMKDSQYITKEAVKLLKSVCSDTYTTTGQVTDLLRDEWELKHLLQDLSFDKYKAIGQIEVKEYKDSSGSIKTYETIKDWSKRDDHRHHAVDALICALTDQKIIFKLNNLNKIYQYKKDTLSKEELQDLQETFENGLNLKEFIDHEGHVFDCPIPKIRKEAKSHLESIFISIKKDNGKVLTKTINRPKNGQSQTTWVPRARLHEETVMGRIKRIAKKKAKLNSKFKQVDNIVNPELRDIVKDHLENHGNNPSIAFTTKTLSKSPINYQNKVVTEVLVYEEVNSKRVPLSENISKAQVEKIVDNKIKQLVNERINKYGGKIKEAFKSINENPLWLNEDQGLQVKSITVYDDSQTIPTSQKRDLQGNSIISMGHIIPTGYVKKGGNHHALIYKDENGKYKDKVISFWDAVGIGLANINATDMPYPIIDKSNDPDLGDFHFSMQINDLFVFDLIHSENPENENEIDFFDPLNRSTISSKLFRLQKMTKKASGAFEVTYRHHLEASLNRSTMDLKGLTWDEHGSNTHLARLTKIRTNHLGQIIKVGE